MSGTIEVNGPTGQPTDGVPEAAPERPAVKRPRGAVLAWPELSSTNKPWWDAITHPPVRPVELSDQGICTGRIHIRISGLAHAPRIWGPSRYCMKGGGLKMARILAVLSALASLFLVAGASAKY